MSSLPVPEFFMFLLCLLAALFVGAMSANSTRVSTPSQLLDALLTSKTTIIVAVDIHVGSVFPAGQESPLLLQSSIMMTGPSQSSYRPALNLTTTSNPIFSVAPGSQVTLGRLRVITQLVEPSIQSFGALLPFSLDSVSAPGLLLEDMEVQTDCGTVMQYQQYVCRLNTTLITGPVEISSPFWIYVRMWQSDTVVMHNVNITCVPEALAVVTSTEDGNVLPAHPACLATAISNGSALLTEAARLQTINYVPGGRLLVLLILQCNIQITQADVLPYWPLGLNISSRVAMVAPMADNIIMDLMELVNIFYIHPYPGSLVIFSAIIMINLPISYNAPSFGTVTTVWRHMIGPLQYMFWAANRRWPTVRGVPETWLLSYSCSMVITYDQFAYLSYWLALGNSEDASVRVLASWAIAVPMIQQTGIGGRVRYIINNSTNGPDSVWNMSVMNPMGYTLMTNDSGLLNMARIGGTNAYVPAINHFQVTSVVEMQFALNSSMAGTPWQKYGLNILLCANISGLNFYTYPNSTIYPGMMTVLPKGFYAATPPTLPAELLPLTPKLATKVTTWPTASTCWDFQILPYQIFKPSPFNQLTLQSLSLINLPTSTSMDGTGLLPRLVSGLWPFLRAEGDYVDSVILDDVIIYVPQTELQVYRIALGLDPGGNLTLSAAGHSTMAAWLIQSQVSSQQSLWIHFSFLKTPYFQGTNVNLTTVVPSACADSTVLPVDVSYGAFLAGDSAVSAPDGTSSGGSAPGGSSGATSGSDGDLPAWAIAVVCVCSGLVAVAGVVGAVVFARRRHGQHDDTKEDSHHSAGGYFRISSLILSSVRSVRSTSSSARGVSPEVVVVMTNPMTPQTGRGIRSQAASMPTENSFDLPAEQESHANMLDVLKQRRLAMAATGLNVKVVDFLSRRDNQLHNDHLEVYEVLGCGSTGVVYRCIWKGLPVAAKVMVLHQERHDESRRHMLEALISTSLVHPNIVTTYMYDLRQLRPDCRPNSTRDATSPWIATAEQLVLLQELCDGGTLRKLMDVEPLPLPHALQLALEVTSALQHLHSKHIVHSDLTPNNILLKTPETPGPASGLRWTAKVADFGLSVAMEPNKTHASRMFHGTPFYIAPETLHEGQLSKASDIFTFGLLLYELFGGTVQSPIQPSNMESQESTGLNFSGAYSYEQQPTRGLSLMGMMGAELNVEATASLLDEPLSKDVLEDLADLQPWAPGGPRSEPLSSRTAGGEDERDVAAPDTPTRTVLKPPHARIPLRWSSADQLFSPSGPEEGKDPSALPALYESAPIPAAASLPLRLPSVPEMAVAPPARASLDVSSAWNNIAGGGDISSMLFSADVPDDTPMDSGSGVALQQHLGSSAGGSFGAPCLGDSALWPVHLSDGSQTAAVLEIYGHQLSVPSTWPPGCASLVMDCCKANPRDRPGIEEVRRLLLTLWKSCGGGGCAEGGCGFPSSSDA